MGLKLMCFVAHPDDECFGFGGALALCALRGIETRVICLTDGKAASHRGSSSSSEDLGRMRRDEFAASCRVLGVSHHELLNYEDGQLESVSFSDAAGELVRRIRDFQPDVLLTFGGDGGMNTHPDHSMTSFLTTAAFHWAGQVKRYPELGKVYQAARLFYLSTDFLLPDRPAPLPVPWTLTLEIAAVRERKLEACRQHASQAPLLERTKDLFERHGGHELYALVATRELSPATPSTDLFDGLASAQ